MKIGLIIGLMVSIPSLFSSSIYAQVFSCDLDPHSRLAGSIINGVVLDHDGNINVIGSTRSPQFPTRKAFQRDWAGDYDVFIARISSDGSCLIVSTYLGGIGEDRAGSIGVDSFGQVFVTGYTDSDDFPLKNPYQPSRAGKTDAFITKFSSSASELIFSTYIGGSLDDAGLGLVQDTGRDIYVSGETLSSDFPTENSYQASRSGSDQDLFLARISPDGSELFFSTYLGGDSVDFGGSIDLGSEESVFITGTTWSDNFPTRGCYQAARMGKYDAFVTRFASSGSVLIYSTYLGGKGFDYGNDIAIDAEGCAYVVGSTLFEEFPLVSPLLEYEDEEGDAFLSRLSSTGSSLLFSTRYGSGAREHGSAVALDSGGAVYILGTAESSDIPLRNPFQPKKSGECDLFVARILTSNAGVVYSTYLGGDEIESPGGIVVDSAYSAILVGYTYSYNFPISNPLQRTLTGGSAGFITRLSSSGSYLSFSTYLAGRVSALTERDR